MECSDYRSYLLIHKEKEEEEKEGEEEQILEGNSMTSKTNIENFKENRKEERKKRIKGDQCLDWALFIYSAVILRAIPVPRGLSTTLSQYYNSTEIWNHRVLTKQ